MTFGRHEFEKPYESAQRRYHLCQDALDNDSQSCEHPQDQTRCCLLSVQLFALAEAKGDHRPDPVKPGGGEERRRRAELQALVVGLDAAIAG